MLSTLYSESAYAMLARVTNATEKRELQDSFSQSIEFASGQIKGYIGICTARSFFDYLPLYLKEKSLTTKCGGFVVDILQGQGIDIRSTSHDEKKFKIVPSIGTMTITAKAWEKQFTYFNHSSKEYEFNMSNKLPTSLARITFTTEFMINDIVPAVLPGVDSTHELPYACFRANILNNIYLHIKLEDLGNLVTPKPFLSNGKKRNREER